MKRRLSVLVGGAAAAALLSSPAVLNDYWLRVATGVLLWVAMAEALNLILGLAGYPAFGNGVFLGLGAYTTAVLMNAGWGFWPALAGAAVLAFAFATLIGLPVLRLRGHYFAIATIGVNFALLALVQNLGLTGGGSGLSVPLFPGTAHQLTLFFFYAFAALALASIVLFIWVRRSALGYALRAIQASEEAARVMGINTTRFKVTAWALSALVTGIAGGLYAYWNGFIIPENAFDIVNSVVLFIMVLLGGAGTVFGPVVGAAGLELVSEFLWSRMGTLHLAVLGLVILLVGILIPRGLIQRGGLRPGSVPRRAVPGTAVPVKRGG